MRRRLLVLVAATVALVIVAFLVPLALLVRDVAADRAAQAATAQAQSLSSLVATADRASLALLVEQTPGVTVFLPDGSTLGAAATRSPLVELAARGTSASSDVADGREIVFAVGLADGFGVIRTFVPDAELTRGVTRAWLLLALLGAGLLALGLFLADRLARTLVRGTADLAAVSHRLARGELDARASPDAPDEIGTVARALNDLGARITELLREERETIADLSHRVRTPLTALRLEAEALRDPGDARRIGDGVDAVQRAVSQVINQARGRAGEHGPELDALAEDTGRAVGGDVAPGPLPVAVGRSDLEACVDALLGNVFAHTPDGTPFEVWLTPATPHGAVLVIADAGPGLSSAGAAERGTSGAGSTGLGLDIARRTAEHAGGALRLGTSPAGGLAVTLHLPAPTSPGPRTGPVSARRGPGHADR